MEPPQSTATAARIRADVGAYGLMRGVGNLCAGSEDDPAYDARHLVHLLVSGLTRVDQG